jgi:hypothetical protein
MNTAALRTAVHSGYTGSLLPAAYRFHRASKNPEATQADILRNFLKTNQETAYGTAHHYADIHTVRDFQDKVPVVDYDVLEPWITRAADGEPQVLSSEPIKMFERSSGSSAATKLIPYTESLFAQFSAATNAWMANVFLSVPSLIGKQSYWSVSPAARDKVETKGGIPIGLEDDTEYFGPVGRWALSQLMAVDGRVARISDLDTWRRTTLVGLLESQDLGLLSIWSPTFLVTLMTYLEENLHALLRELSPQRRYVIQQALDQHGRFAPEAIWPSLKFISMWTDGHAARYVALLQAYFPNTPIQSKGLLATEGVVSFPLVDRAAAPFINALHASALAVTSHFYEFIDLDRPESRPLLAHQLIKGKSYSPLLTTGNGFARYHLKDTLECVGHRGELPFLRFTGKLDRTSDLVGEKLNANLVERALHETLEEAGLTTHFAMVAPATGGTPPYYELFIEPANTARLTSNQLKLLETTLEQHFKSNYHYQYARDLGQLGPVKAHSILDGWKTYATELVKRGAREGDIKPTPLHTADYWYDTFHARPRRTT